MRQPTFKPNARSILLFILLAVCAWGMYLFGQGFFPGENWVPWLGRTAMMLIVDWVVVSLSIRLLRQHGLPAQAIGLAVGSGTIVNIIVGVLTGFLSVLILAALLYIFVPYHFVAGPLGFGQVFKEGVSYLVGNSLEELLFRGALFVILSQWIGWRVSMLILALFFGLFHLPGIGFTVDGAKMVATTASFAFIFGLSYVLTNSLWTAISTHVTANICLHALAGLDGAGKAVIIPLFERPWPKGYDLGLAVTVATSAIVSFLLYRMILRRDKKQVSNGSRTGYLGGSGFGEK